MFVVRPRAFGAVEKFYEVIYIQVSLSKKISLAKFNISEILSVGSVSLIPTRIIDIKYQLPTFRLQVLQSSSGHIIQHWEYKVTDYCT